MIRTPDNFYKPRSLDTMLDMRNAIQPEHLMHMIARDPGLPNERKQPLLTMLSTPEVFDHLLVGAAGAALALAVAKFAELDKAPKVLVGLAGFGIGNVVYNMLKENKFTSFDPHTGIATLHT